MPIKNIVIQGYYGLANTGDEAILDCLLQSLGDDYPETNITVFSSDIKHTQRHHSINVVQSSLPNNLYDLILRSFGRNRRNFFKALSAFVKADVLLVGGGGLFHDAPHSNKYFLNRLYKILWAKRMGIRVAVLSVTIGPLHFEESKKRLREVFNRVDLITVREEQSKGILLDIGLSQPKIWVTGDVVFLLKPAGEQRVQEIIRDEKLALGDSPIIAICLCAYKSEHPGRIQAISAFCDYASSILGARIWFIPMQTSPQNDDRAEAKAVLGLVKNPNCIECIEGQYSPRDILGLIGKTQAVLAERLHGSIMAINANVPCFGIGYSPKVTWLFDKIGYSQYHMLLKDLTSSRLNTEFFELWKRRKQVRRELKAISMQLKFYAHENFRHFKECFAAEYVKNS